MLPIRLHLEHRGKMMLSNIAMKEPLISGVGEEKKKALTAHLH